MVNSSRSNSKLTDLYKPYISVLKNLCHSLSLTSPHSTPIDTIQDNNCPIKELLVSLYNSIFYFESTTLNRAVDRGSLLDYMMIAFENSSHTKVREKAGDLKCQRNLFK